MKDIIRGKLSHGKPWKGKKYFDNKSIKRQCDSYNIYGAIYQWI